MKEARIVLPDHPWTSFAAHFVRKRLIRHFGGYTETHGHGAWRDGEGQTLRETVRVWDVAIDETDVGKGMLLEIAQRAGHLAEQECVYVRFGDGTVQLVPSFTPEEYAALGQSGGA